MGLTALDNSFLGVTPARRYMASVMAGFDVVSGRLWESLTHRRASHLAREQHFQSGWR